MGLLPVMGFFPHISHTLAIFSHSFETLKAPLFCPIGAKASLNKTERF
jgi:hypothetical protein